MILSPTPLEPSLEKDIVFENHQKKPKQYSYFCIEHSPLDREMRCPGPSLDPLISCTRPPGPPRGLLWAKHAPPGPPQGLLWPNMNPQDTPKAPPEAPEHLSGPLKSKRLTCLKLQNGALSPPWTSRKSVLGDFSTLRGPPQDPPERAPLSSGSLLGTQKVAWERPGSPQGPPRTAPSAPRTLPGWP